MGAWGTGIYDDDLTCDVRDDFIGYLEEGKTAEQATKIIVDEYLDEYSFEDDLEVISLVYIGLAAIQVEKKCLQEDVRKMAVELIECSADLEAWGEADEKDYEERKAVLGELKHNLLHYK